MLTLSEASPAPLWASSSRPSPHRCLPDLRSQTELSGRRRCFQGLLRQLTFRIGSAFSPAPAGRIARSPADPALRRSEQRHFFDSKRTRQATRGCQPEWTCPDRSYARRRRRETRCCCSASCRRPAGCRLSSRRECQARGRCGRCTARRHRPHRAGRRRAADRVIHVPVALGTSDREPEKRLRRVLDDVVHPPVAIAKNRRAR